jgi:hypothetical protein
MVIFDSAGRAIDYFYIPRTTVKSIQAEPIPWDF